MGDSEDETEYRRQSRDKFRVERGRFDSEGYASANNSSGGGNSNSARNWSNRSYRDQRGNREGGYYEGRRGGPDRYGNEPSRLSPPSKRSRHHEWYDDVGHPRERPRGPPPIASRLGYPHPEDMGSVGVGVQPPLMSFKAFLSTQDDTIGDEEALKKYSEYKLEFKRQQLNEFFVAHKDEEWFKMKYHPEASVQRKSELRSALSKRLEVFNHFHKSGKFNSITVDGDQAEILVKLLDSVVIFLEGGAEEDLKVLDEKPESERPQDSISVVKEEKTTTAKEEKNEGAKEEKEEKADETKIDVDESKKEEKNDTAIPDEKGETMDKVLGDEAEKKGVKRKRESEGGVEDLSDDDSIDDDSNKEKEDVSKEDSEGKKEDITITSDQKTEEMKEEEEEEDINVAATKPRELHRTSSIFLRNLAPTITKREIEAICKRYNGFLRAAIADPSPDRKWFRRGWVTFQRDVKIKEICYNLNNIRLRDFEIGPIVNRDLTRRIRTVSGLTVDRKVVRNDIKLAAKVITNLDKRWDLWTIVSEKKEDKEGSKEGEKESETQEASDIKDLKDSSVSMLATESSNPVLANITDYLIEEASAEEEELLGKNNNDLEDGEEGEEGNTIVRDSELISVLDRLLLYLRIVHSVDFYNHSEYPNEDEMPNRCGIMHARGIPPSGNVTQGEIEEYCTSFERKMGSFLKPREDVKEEEAMKLGLKKEEEEVEKFVMANTQELGKDKWLCPLSGKKFKGADFVRKHIFNKHTEKIEEVKKEVKYYNNYLRDPKRPQLPENPLNQQSNQGSRNNNRQRREPPYNRGPQDPYHYSGHPREATSYPVYDHDRMGPPRGYDRFDNYRGMRGPPPPHGPPHNRPMPDFFPGSGRFNPYGGGGGGSGGRPIITYRDLDAPRDDF